MTFKTISDKPRTFRFTYDFEEFDTAQVASHAILGYMIGTYRSSVVETTFKDKGRLVVEYSEDKKLNKVFKKICDSLKDCYELEALDVVANE